MSVFITYKRFPSVTNTHFPDSQVFHITKCTVQHLELPRQTEFSYAGCLPQTEGFLLFVTWFSCFCESCSFGLLFKNLSKADHAINQAKVLSFSAEPGH